MIYKFKQSGFGGVGGAWEKEKKSSGLFYHFF